MRDMCRSPPGKRLHNRQKTRTARRQMIAKSLGALLVQLFTDNPGRFQPLQARG
jgi:hypothetical protein